MGAIQGKELLDSLPTLSVAELREVQKRTAVLLALGGARASAAIDSSASSATDLFCESLYRAFCDLLYTRHRVKNDPWPQFCKRRDTQAQTFVKELVVVAGMNEQWFPKQSTADRERACRLYARLCLNHVEASGEVAFWRILAWALRDLPVLVDQAFPGYAEAGLMHMVLKKA